MVKIIGYYVGIILVFLTGTSISGMDGRSRGIFFETFLRAVIIMRDMPEAGAIPTYYPTISQIATQASGKVINKSPAKKKRKIKTTTQSSWFCSSKKIRKKLFGRLKDKAFYRRSIQALDIADGIINLPPLQFAHCNISLFLQIGSFWPRRNDLSQTQKELREKLWQRNEFINYD